MPTSDRRTRPFAALVAALVLCAAGPALAAQVTDVRVGVHPKFTRVVFELDGSAGYKVEKLGGDASPELRITIEATSAARELRGRHPRRKDRSRLEGACAHHAAPARYPRQR
jgi:hypothetical protein